ncbi:hypothetical protein D3C77_664310 [compost metagenome]
MHPLSLPLVDQTGVVSTAGGVRVEPFEGALERFGKHLCLAFGDQHIVRGNADLTGIETLAVGNAQRGILKVRLRTYQGW